MATKDDFKLFVSKNPDFAFAVKENKTSWQHLFEMYDIYGEDSVVWNQFRSIREEKVIQSDKKSSKKSLGKITEGILSTGVVKDILNGLKKIDVDSLQDNIGGIQKAVGFIEEIALNRDETKAKEKEKKETVRKKKKGPEPIERFFDD